MSDPERTDPEPSDQAPEFVVVKRLSDPASAKLVAQILLGEGIPAFVLGTNLQDEFAMTQMMLGGVGCDVQVPKAFEERAKAVLAAAKDAGEQFPEDDAP